MFLVPVPFENEVEDVSDDQVVKSCDLLPRSVEDLLIQREGEVFSLLILLDGLLDTSELVELGADSKDRFVVNRKGFTIFVSSGLLFYRESFGLPIK